ncbi:MAG TPA: glycosyltransferase family 9 protein [Myxococcota bacterium]|nr:glycosyltransferase family 9 protein [Myxococcota bacterium]
MSASDPENLGRRAAGRARDPIRRVRRTVRRFVLGALAPFASDGSAPLPDLRACRRILLVSVNERLGNSILPTAPVAALRAALPEARLDFVGGPLAPAILRGLGVATVRTLKRSDAWRPWRLLALVRALRAERYDAAIHLAGSTGSLGALLVGASGATHRIGVRRADGNVFFTSALEPPDDVHKVDELRALVRQLGVDAPAGRCLALAPEERAAAAERLARELGPDGAAPVAIFVGGRARKGKAWPLEAFAKVAEGLRAQHLPILVFLGPEELAREGEIRAALGPAHYVAEPDLRRVAALVAACRAVLAPDSGPMHLAIAAGTPTVAIFMRENFDRWGPQAAHGRVIYDPQGHRAGEALDALLKSAARRP